MTESSSKNRSLSLPSFEKHGKVSVWCSSVSYDTIPDRYFEEDEDGTDAWSRGFAISQYEHENMETNGVASGTAAVKDIVEQCSYSSAYGLGVVHKINKMGHQQISWLILLFDFEYRNKLTKIHEDEYVQYVGSFVYDMDALTLAEQEEIEAARQLKLAQEEQFLRETKGQDEQAVPTNEGTVPMAKSEAKPKPKPKAQPAAKTKPSPDQGAKQEPKQEPKPKGFNPWLK